MNADSVLNEISSFADPGTDVSIKAGTTHVDISIVREGEDLRITVDLSNGKTTLRGEDLTHKFSSIGGLLASSHFADIRRLSATQKQVFSKFNESAFIEPEGIINDLHNSRRLSINGLDEVLLNSPNGKVRVVLLDGQAGVGKTSLIRRLLIKRAHGINVPPIIHVESLGSRLFGLNHLLAASLDSLRAKFTFDQVPALVRNGLIQIAIDGFDELADSEGYADAWSALSDFISDIGGGGSIILAGRDTFFDQQAFNERLADTRQNIELVGARLSPISPGNARSYLKENGWGVGELNSNVGLELLKEGSYVLRPFFLKTLAEEEIKSWNVLSENITIRNLLVDRFLIRESGLISKKTSLSLTKAKSLLSTVFSEIALELAASETDTVDTTFIELMVDTVFSGSITNHELGRLTYKAGSIALLEPDEGRRGYRRFPHTEISNFFLTYGIIKGEWSSQMRRVLGRARLLVDFFSLFSEEFSVLPDDDARRFITMIETALNSETSASENLSANLAGLWVATLSHGWDTEEARQISNVQMNDAAIIGEASKAKFDGVMINRLDVRGADICSVEFLNSGISTVITDDHTRFGESIPDIAHVQVTEQGSAKNLRGNDATAWLQAHRRQPFSGGSQGEAEALLWRIASTLTRRYVIRDSIVDPSGRFLRDNRWRAIEDILREAGRIERVPNRGGGPQDDFVRILDPIGLMRREDKVSRAIWEKVRALG